MCRTQIRVQFQVSCYRVYKLTVLGDALEESPPWAQTRGGLLTQPHLLSWIWWKRRRRKWKKIGGNIATMMRHKIITFREHNLLIEIDFDLEFLDLKESLVDLYNIVVIWLVVEWMNSISLIFCCFSLL